MATDKIIQPSNGSHQIMSSFKNTFSDHGNDIEEIISHRLPRVVRWGTAYFFFLLLLICIISWVIKYPDIVVASGKLSSVNAPKQVIARIDGKLIKIFFKEIGHVEAGQVLGYMESIADPKAVMVIRHQVDSIATLINQNRTDEIIKYFPSNASRFGIGRDGALGELQIPYQTFIQSFITFSGYLSSGFVLRKKDMLFNDMQNLEKLHGIATIQKSLYEQDLSLSYETFNANDTLIKDKIISPLEYRNEKSKLIAKQLSLPQIDASIISIETQQNEKRKEIVELENQIMEEKNTFIQALQTIKSQIETWESKYLLKAPVSGTVSFTGFFQENQEIKAGQALFNVQPVNTSYFVEMLVPQYNFGKVQRGQKVLLKFQAYPFEQYGFVVGKIDYINPTPTDSGYLAKAILPDGLISNYKKQLQFRNGLLAQADIVTKDLRLLERFYYTMRKN